MFGSTLYNKRMIREANLVTYKAASKEKETEKHQIMGRFLKRYSEGIKIIFSNGGWDSHRLDQVFSNILKWGVRTLWLDRNQQPTVIPKIMHIDFYALHTLVLYENYIESVESLCCLNAPHLNGLSLISNYISDASSLRRLNCSELAILQLGNNKISQMQWCSQLHAQITTLSLQYQDSFNHCPSITWILKLQTSVFELINFEAINKIQASERLKNTVSKKYPELFFVK